jgi:hypothetical protein
VYATRNRYPALLDDCPLNRRHPAAVNDGMSGSTFQTNPFDLHRLLEDCHRGALQLPDFQRSWVWDEDRIKSLIASISRAFPVGALMTRMSSPRPVLKAARR